MVKKKNTFEIMFIFLVSITVSTGCGPITIHSNWLDRQVTVDGHDDDWRDATEHKDNINCAFGILNDDKNIYISLTPWNHTTQGQIITTGMIVWLDTTGEEEKTQGIAFPLAGMGHDSPQPLMDTRDGTTQFMERFSESQKKLQLINTAEGDTTTVSLDNAREMGIEVAVGDAGGRLSYELKVPISSEAGKGFHMECKPGDTVFIGFESGDDILPPENEESEYDKYIRDGERSTGLITDQYRRSNRRYPYRSMSGGRRQPEPFMVWAEVTLAKTKE